MEGDWRTHHKFFHRNRRLLAEVEELETRMRRRDLRVDDETLFEFYDERIGPEVVSERHFDKWWKDARRGRSHAARLRPGRRAGRRTPRNWTTSAFPKTWQQGSFELPLSYEFSAGGARRRPESV